MQAFDLLTHSQMGSLPLGEAVRAKEEALPAEGKQSGGLLIEPPP